jgi:serine/threonine-protein kinase
MRNEIYARHGRRFQREEIQTYFSATGWYAPRASYSDNDLGDLEKRNAAFIREYQDTHGLRW